MATLRFLDVLLVCEICEGEVDIHEESPVAQCRHCGIAFSVDLPELHELSA
jgi:transcription elongation factor Elf1